MKTIKTFLAVLTFIMSFISVFSVNSIAKPRLKQDYRETIANYVEYVVIDGKLWKITYSDDGNVIERIPVFD